MIWFKSNKANGYAFLPNFWPHVQPAARKAVYQLFPNISPLRTEEKAEADDEADAGQSGKGGFVLTVDGVRYPTVEHHYHYTKYTATHPAIAANILAAPTATVALKRNTAHKRTTPLPAAALTQSKLSAAMLTALRAKFGQHGGLRTALLGSGERVLAEVPGRGKGNVWVGRDGQLGVLLMQVRSELREEEALREQVERKEVSSEVQEEEPLSKRVKRQPQ